MKILVGSKNPVKLESVRDAFSKYFNEIEIIGVDVNSNVPDQPINDETYSGALSRSTSLVEINRKENLGADYFVGIEGGIAEAFGKWFAFGCVSIIDKFGHSSFGTSAHFELPEKVTAKLLNREELGIVMDEIMQEENTKQKMGAIGFFTNGVMDRKELYASGVIAALVPFNHKQMYFGKDEN
ncbi:MAG: inosine/xanthosine triphosphatase [Bacteroidetes bacterium]|nr:inosine/xanthosine triphosphatase [Bacteroidota bacterium]MBU1680034.1 inosine/xanthosine triphosphatase [Bacteroidota bacterium]MBU2505246.1 inosine/xanthosine triphosphatase [Bacteroidota bacterium]